MNSVRRFGESTLIIYQPLSSDALLLMLFLVTTLALLTAFASIGIRLLFNYEYIPNLVSIESVKDMHFDYIIIGSGTAGSVLAFELSVHSNYTVLLIEAGGIFNFLSIVPLMSTMMQVCHSLFYVYISNNSYRVQKWTGS